MEKETIIISLGGSLIIPNDIDINFLEEFKNLIVAHVNKQKRFVIITGGGMICRRYQNVLKQLEKPTEEDLDWLGIYSTRFNAEFVKILFRDLAGETIILDPTSPILSQKPIIVGGGWKPGWSTDYVAVVLGKQLKAKKIINLSNTDHVYDSDPKLNPNAKKIEKISWAEYRKIIPNEWNPGLNTPFDPIASEMAEKEGIEVVIMNGKPINNLKNYLDGEKFLGTVIS